MTTEEKVELKRKQFEMAMQGDVRMLVWLGKQHLGQSENPMFDEEELCEGFEIQVIGEKCEDCGKEIQS